MAKNLRAKIAKTDTMVINDVNDSATKQFVEEVGNVTIAKTVREVAEQTVCSLFPRLKSMISFPETLLKMIFKYSSNDQCGANRS